MDLFAISDVRDVTFAIDENIFDSDSSKISASITDLQGNTVSISTSNEPDTEWHLDSSEEEANAFIEHQRNVNGTNFDLEVELITTPIDLDSDKISEFDDFETYSQLFGSEFKEHDDSGKPVGAWIRHLIQIGDDLLPKSELQVVGPFYRLSNSEPMQNVYRLLFLTKNADLAGDLSPRFMADRIRANRAFSDGQSLGESPHFLEWIDRMSRVSTLVDESHCRKTSDFLMVSAAFNFVSAMVRKHLGSFRQVVGTRPRPSKITNLQEVSLKWMAESTEMKEAFFKFTDSRYSIHARELGHLTGQQELLVEDHFTGVRIGLDQVGTGLSQVMPIFGEMYSESNDELDSKSIYIEQPELHLHPKYQAKFAELFCEFVSMGNRQMIVETHSESVLLRIQKWIRDGKISKNLVAIGFTSSKGRITAENGTILGGSNEVHNLELGSNGDIDLLPESFVDMRIADWL
jgi:hypothetical protein